MSKNNVLKKNSGRKEKDQRLYAAPALNKGLDILELLSREADGITMSDIALKLDRSVNEIFRMLMVLRQRSYVSCKPATDRYVLTMKIFELAHRHLPVKRMTNVALPVMRRLADRIEQSCHMVIYYNGCGIVTAQVDSPAPRGISVCPGASVPLINSCSGHLLLSYADEDTRAEMLEQARLRHGKFTMTKKKMNEMIQVITKNGYESIVSAQISGVKDIGFPIFDYSGKLVSALVVPFIEHLDSSQATTFDEAHVALCMAAEAISGALGYSASG